jgi:hypothetical protein
VAFTNRPSHTSTLLQCDGDAAAMSNASQLEDNAYLLGCEHTTPHVRYTTPSIVAFSNGSLFDEASGGPKVAYFRSHLASAIERLSHAQCDLQTIDDSVEDSCVEIIGVDKDGEHSELYAELNSIARSKFVSQLLSNAAQVMDESALFSTDDVLKLESFAPDIYVSADELLACQQVCVSHSLALYLPISISLVCVSVCECCMS